MAPLKWSVSELHSMPEGEWRTFLTMRLDSIEEQMSAVAEAPKCLEAIERRCAGRRWHGKILWAALLSSVGLVVERILRGHG